jgi:hypothetical protein
MLGMLVKLLPVLDIPTPMTICVGFDDIQSLWKHAVPYLHLNVKLDNLNDRAAISW